MELLRRCLDEFDFKGVSCPALCIDINKLLAQPEQEPLSGKWWYGKGVEDTKYFLKREPLSDEVIAEQAVWAANSKHPFKEGVKWAEQQHSIGDRDE